MRDILDYKEFFEGHPYSPGEGSYPILEIVLWQLPDNSGIMRTYGFLHQMITDPKQAEVLGQTMKEVLDLLLHRMEEVGVVKAVSPHITPTTGSVH